MFGLPALIDSYWLQVLTGVVIYSIVTLGLGILIGRVGLVSLCQFVLLAIGAWVALRLDYATSIPFPVLILIAGVITGVIGTLIGLPGAAAGGPVPGADHADGGRRDHRRAAHRAVPERRERVLRQLGVRRHLVTPAPPVARARRRRLLPLLRRRRRADVPARPVARHGQGRAGVGGAAPEPGHGRRRRRQHDALQAVGVRPGVVHGRGRGRPAGGGQRRRGDRPVPGPELDPPPRRRADGRRLQPLGRRRRRPAAAAAAGAARRLGRVDRGAHDPVRRRRAAGAAHRAGWPGRAGAEGPGEARASHRRRSSPAGRRGSGRRDRGRRASPCASAASSRSTA